jgi:probable rRNA maturation factor
VVDERGRPLRIRGLAAWLRRVAPAQARGEVTIALVSDTRMRALNRQYRQKDYATDVLSFPEGGTGRKNGFPIQPIQPIPPPRVLGEIVIARGMARRQARETRHAELAELKLLALHGLLHLLGYDHERDNGRMRRVERRLRRKGALGEGLIERAAR